jgi:DNA/RNA endonuclease YhcR with UshA esterase domain
VEVPLLTVEESQGTMNMAYVRLKGEISRGLSYDPESDYLAFWLDDGTGEVRISAYRDVTQALLAAGEVPALGDGVEVAGTLRIREDLVSLTLNVPEHLTLHRPDPVTVDLGALSQLDEGLRVRASGVVREIFTPYDGLTLLTLRDNSGEVEVAVDETLTALTGPLPEVAEGHGLVVTGTVTLYRDEPQLTPASVTDLVVTQASSLESEGAPVASYYLNQLSADDVGSNVRVKGNIVAFEGFKGGLKATLDDGTGMIVLLIWQDIYDALSEPRALDVGAEVAVTGEVAVYEEELEVVPQAPEDIEIVTAAPDIPWVDAGALSEVDVGRIVRLRGVLKQPDAFSAGIKVPLDDGTGTVTVLLWSNVVADLTPAPEAGLPIEVTGEVALYQNTIELIPRSPYDWRAAE